MKIRFHPSQVRTRDQILAADRHKTIKDLAAQRESLFLAHDSVVAVDYHDAPGQVALHLAEDQDFSHKGFAKRDGRLDIRSSSSQREEQLQRSEDGTRLSLVSIDEQGVFTEEFQYQQDGSVSYMTSTQKSEEAPHLPVTYRLGAVNSPEQVEAHETYLDIQSRFQRLEELIDLHDGSPDFDFNESDGVLATDSLPVSSAIILDGSLSGTGPMTSEDYKLKMEGAGNRNSSNTPLLRGYIADDGEVDATLNWKLSAYGDEAFDGSYRRSPDKSKAVIETDIKFRYEEFRERAEFKRSPAGDVTVERSFQDNNSKKS